MLNAIFDNPICVTCDRIKSNHVKEVHCMRVSVILPYDEASKYYERWAHEEKNIDFKNDLFSAQRCTLSFAAEEICLHLERAGIDVKVTDEKSDVNVILKCRDMEGEEFDIFTEGTDVILDGESRKGTLYAAYEFLEAQGIRWYSPIQDYVPTLTTITMPEAKHYRYELPYGRGFHFEQLMKEGERFIIWMARNRLNLHNCHAHSKALQDKLGFVYKIGGHIFEKILHPKNITEDGRYYIDAHKDWYGKRDEEITADNAINAQFCVSNPELLDVLADTVIDKIKNEWKNENLFELAGFDTWGKSCQCDKCRKLGNGTDVTLHFLSHIRKRVDEAYASGEIDHNIKLSFDIYEGTATLEAPSKPVPQNLLDAGDYGMYSPILRCYDHDLYDTSCKKNQIYERTLRDWSNSGMAFAINEYYNVSKFEDLPILFTTRMKNEIKYYIESGAKEIQYMHVPFLEWGVRTITQYLYANLSRDKDCDADALIDKYFDDLYGKYSARAKEAYELIEDATRLCMSWRGWFETGLLTFLCEWDGSVPTEPFHKEYHLGDNAVSLGYESVFKLRKALKLLRDIKYEELSVITPDTFAGGSGALNPGQQKKVPLGTPILNRINEDIRGVLYGADVYELMVLCHDYYNALYEGRADAKELYNKIKELGDRMSEYTFGINFEMYTPDSELRTALKHSQLTNLYYKIIANNNIKEK